MNYYFTAHQTPFRVPEHKPNVYSTWDGTLLSPSPIHGSVEDTLLCM